MIYAADEPDEFVCGGEQGPAPDHDIEWEWDDDVGHCRNCGAEFFDEEEDE